MARAATRSAQQRRARAKQQQAQRHPAFKQTFRHGGTRFEMPAPPDPMASAIHEAGHCAVAHSVGHHVVFVTIKREIVLPGKLFRKGLPGQHRNLTGAPQVDDGFHLAEPLRADEINARADSGLPLTGDQRQWLIEEAVVTVAGPLAELHTGLGNGGADGDLQQLAIAAKLLGKTEQRNGQTFIDETWSHAVQMVAITILQESWTLVEEFTDQLLANEEMHAEACQTILSASPCGSHTQLLAELL